MSKTSTTQPRTLRKLFSAADAAAFGEGRKTQFREPIGYLNNSQRVFMLRDGRLWASMTPEELAPLDEEPPRSVFGGQAICDGEMWYTPIVVGCGKRGEGNPAMPPYPPGTRLWVPETWGLVAAANSSAHNIRRGTTLVGDWDLIKRDIPYEFRYLADGYAGNKNVYWRHPNHMPRAAARLWLTVRRVRVERCMDITTKGVVAEGFPFASDLDQVKLAFAEKYGPDAWQQNPWVFVYEVGLEREGGAE